VTNPSNHVWYKYECCPLPVGMECTSVTNQESAWLTGGLIVLGNGGDADVQYIYNQVRLCYIIMHLLIYTFEQRPKCQNRHALVVLYIGFPISREFFIFWESGN
jgi:hypothetical protein